MHINNALCQLDDDPDVLELMLKDSRNANPIYHPTQYWQLYQDQQVPALRSDGLKDIRRNTRNYFTSFNGTDRAPSFFSVDNLLRQRIGGIPEFEEVTKLLNGLIEDLPEEKWLPYGLSLRDIRETAYRLAKYYGLTRRARNIEDFQASLAGNAADVFSVEGRTYTYRALYFYMKYAYCSLYVDFNDVDTLVELGAGMGKQCEVIKKLHPDVTYLIFDLPTQLYVCEKFLQKVFPDNVVPYSECRDMTDLSGLKKGHIHLFGNWQFPILRGHSVDLFWNCQSFQEMEPDVVANYTSIVDEITDTVYLCHAKDGVPVGPAGNYAVREAIPIDAYPTRYLPGFEFVDLSPAYVVLSEDDGFGGICDAMLRRRR